MEVKDLSKTDTNKEKSDSNLLSSIRRIMGKKSRNALLALAITGGIGVAKCMYDKLQAENNTAENTQQALTKTVDVFSKPSDLSIQEFEQKLALSGCSMKSSISTGKLYSYVYQDIYDKSGNNVGAYCVCTNSKGEYLKMGDIEINSNNEELGKVLQDMGCSKKGSTNYTFNGEKSHGTIMFEEAQKLQSQLNVSNRLQVEGHTTR